jgi:L-ascorbate metabolism protein UlaG (beta-lactamase superfamily)
MSSPLGIPFAASVSVETRNTALVASLRPFIDQVARGYEATRDLAASVGAASAAHPALAARFDLQPDRFGLAEPYLLPAEDPVTEVSFVNHRRERRLSVEIESGEDLRNVAAVLRACNDGPGAGGALDAGCEELLAGLTEMQFLEPHPSYPLRFQPGDLPGVFRLQHACLLFRSLTTGVLIDPQFHSYSPPELDTTIPGSDLGGQVDAILISHSHGDHFSLASLMLFPRDIPIIVPHVPTPTVLCPDMAGQLRAAGFTRVIEGRWFGPPIVVGDIEISCLPFYGEQPLLTERPRRSELRNWGNTYFVRTPQLGAWVLIDSGNDHLGKMVEVAEQVARVHGAPDLLLSNLRRFAVGGGSSNPFYVQGNGEYWLSLAPAQMHRFSQMNGDVLTLGPSGVAEVCRVAQAREFLPYASWWLPLAEADPEEQQLCGQLAAGLEAHSARTRIGRWTVGDGYLARPGGGFHRRGCLSARRNGQGR